MCVSMISSAWKATSRMYETQIRTPSLNCCFESASRRKDCMKDNCCLRDSTWCFTPVSCETDALACSSSSSVSLVTTVDTATSAMLDLILCCGNCQLGCYLMNWVGLLLSLSLLLLREIHGRVENGSAFSSSGIMKIPFLFIFFLEDGSQRTTTTLSFLPRCPSL